MNRYDITENELRSKRMLRLARGISNIEAILYILNEQTLLKEYCDKEILGENKVYTINKLIEHKEILSKLNIILPNNILYLENQFIGYSMSYIKNNINLATLLADSRISNNEKIDYLKAVGKIINDVHSIKIDGKDFLLGDIHAGNFIIDTSNNNSVYAVDIDSCKIGDNLPETSYYLTRYTYIVEKFTSKFKVHTECYEIIPTKNTDLFCYIVMIIEFIAQYDFCLDYTHQITEYFQYLESLGLNKTLLDIFTKICTAEDNISPLDYLDYLKEIDLKEASHHTFLEKKAENRASRKYFSIY